MISIARSNSNNRTLDECLLYSRYVIIDFGFAKKYRQPPALAQESRSRGGSFPYSSPEKKYATWYNPFLADSFAFGVLLLQAIMGKDILYKKFLKTDSMMVACDNFVQGKFAK